MPEVIKPVYELIEDEERLLEVVQKDLAGKDIVAVDTEATGLDPYLATLLLVQIAVPEKAYVIDAQKVRDLSPLRPVLESKTPLKLLQNAKFDYEMLKVQAGLEIENLYDTFLAERILTCGEARGVSSLGALGRKYLDMELDKNWESYDWEAVARTGTITPRHLEYACLDVLVLFPIFRNQFQQLRVANLLETAKLEFACCPVVAEMEIKGSYIDQKKWRAHIRELEKKRDELKIKIQNELRPFYKNHQTDLFGNHVDVVNLNSPSQLIDAFAKVGVDIPSTGSAILSSIDHPLAKLMLEYRGHEKLITAFGDNLLQHIHPKTGRLHPDYMQIGADTGRFACSKPNLQQIPKESEFRSCFVAPEGRKLVVADYSQIELRILAEMSGDPALVSAFKEGKDLHTYTASLMFGIPEDKVRKDVERFQAKSINFGLMYGRGAHSLGAQLGVSGEEAEKLLERYFKQYSGVKKWLDKVAKEAVSKGFSRTMIGRRRLHETPDPGDPGYDRIVSGIERKGKNTPIQGTSADMIKYALVFLRQKNRAAGIDAFPIQTVHDEIVVEAAEKDAERAKTILEESMIEAGRLMLKKVPVEVEAGISDVWQH